MDDKDFLFDIVKQVKQFYETPVIYLTKKNYSDIVFNTMCTIRKYFHEGKNENENRIIDTIVEYHLEWLRIVNDVEKLKNNTEEDKCIRDDIYRAINYTIEAMNNRLKYLHKYMDNYKSLLKSIDQINLVAELEIVEDMHKDVLTKLKDRLQCFQHYIDDKEFNVKVVFEAEQLLTWIDKIFDLLSMDLSKYINLNVPQLKDNLANTLQKIVQDLQLSDTESAHEIMDKLKKAGQELSFLIRNTATRDLEMNKVLDKISTLESRIDRLENEPTSAAVMALKRKKEYLEKRVQSLENLKTTIKEMSKVSSMKFDDVSEETCICTDYFRFRIFNHLLPPENRERLVTDLCFLWDQAVFGDKSHKSVISILSISEMKEEFTDDFGTFILDENNRKLYKIPGDDKLYQLNEKDELVPLTDDGENIYYYDECGRYFINHNTSERVYKAHASASEYIMDSSGVLIKIKEEREGITYYYDSFGRYYIDSEGKHIYRNEDTISEYEHDGLGNLVRIRSHEDIFEPCPEDVRVSDDFRYLKCVVGRPLRVCIADVMLHQPVDPIKYLSSSLVKFRENMEFRDKKAAESEELEFEREVIRAEERAAAERAALEAALLAQGGSEDSYDSNLLHYATLDTVEDNVGIASTPRVADTK